MTNVRTLDLLAHRRLVGLVPAELVVLVRSRRRVVVVIVVVVVEVRVVVVVAVARSDVARVVELARGVIAEGARVVVELTAGAGGAGVGGVEVVLATVAARASSRARRVSAGSRASVACDTVVTGTSILGAVVASGVVGGVVVGVAAQA